MVIDDEWERERKMNEIRNENEWCKKIEKMEKEKEGKEMGKVKYDKWKEAKGKWRGGRRWYEEEEKRYYDVV